MIPIPTPPVLTGTAQEQLQQLWDYLYRLAERINAQAEQENQRLGIQN